MAKNFNWRDYITLSPDLSPEQVAAVTKSLDDISNFLDGEGQALIKQAYESTSKRNGGKKIEIRRTKDEERPWEEARSFFDPDTGIMQLGNGIVTTDSPNDKQRLSLTEMLVHEFYHAADDYKDILAKTEETLLQLAGLTRDDPRAAGLLARAQDDATSDIGKVKAMVTAILEYPVRFEDTKEISAEEKKLLYRHPFEERVKALKDVGIISPHDDLEKKRGLPIEPTWRFEEDAAQYTDALMSKNYGPNIVLRGRYDNAIANQLTEGKENYLVPPLTGVRYDSAGFGADRYVVEGLGEFPSPPHVKPSVADPACGNER